MRQAQWSTLCFTRERCEKINQNHVRFSLQTPLHSQLSLKIQRNPSVVKGFNSSTHLLDHIWAVRFSCFFHTPTTPQVHTSRHPCETPMNNHVRSTGDWIDVTSQDCRLSYAPRSAELHVDHGCKSNFNYIARNVNDLSGLYLILDLLLGTSLIWPVDELIQKKEQTLIPTVLL